MSGEKPNGRDVIARVARRLVDTGTPPREAEKRARESFLRTQHGECKRDRRKDEGR